MFLAAKAGLIRRKEGWTLTWQGWTVLAGMFLLVHLVLLHGIFPFLAVNAPKPAKILVVEGWIPDYGLPEIKEIFQKGDYQLLVITGNPVLKGEPLFEYNNFAEITRAVLLRNGWDEETVIAVPSAEALKDRSFASAQALRQWMEKSGMKEMSFNLLSRGAHARRSWLLYRKAFPPGTAIGIIAGTDLRYDGKRWWRTSEGVRDVLNETIAYVYAKFIFRSQSLQ